LFTRSVSADEVLKRLSFLMDVFYFLVANGLGFLGFLFPAIRSIFTPIIFAK
jgi:hypothetical protein